MLNSNFILLVFILWMLGYGPVVAFCEKVREKAGIIITKEESNKTGKLNNLIYVITGALLLVLAIVMSFF